MYLYFNKQGELKEIINDESLRQSGTNNKIYIYVEDISALQITAKFKLPTTGALPLIYTSATTVSKKIPYNEKQDLKYFNYVDTWNFYEIPLSFVASGTQYNVLSEPGNVELTVRIRNALQPSTWLVLGLIVFYVEESTDGSYEVQEDEYITLAQFYYLIDNFTTHTDIENALTPTFVGTALTEENAYSLEGGENYNGCHFDLGDSPNGLYIFAYAGCMILLPIYELDTYTEYQISACLHADTYETKILTYGLAENSGEYRLIIYNKENFIPVANTTYLYKIKLY